MIATGYVALRFGLAAHPLIDDVVRSCHRDRALVISVLIEMIEAGLQADDRGDLRHFDCAGTAHQFGVESDDVRAVFDAFRRVGIVSARLGAGYAELHRQDDDQDGQAEGTGQ